MQIKTEKKENSQITFEIQIPKDTVNQLFSKAFKKIVKDVQIPGFRKGRIPRKIFEQRYGKDSIKEEAVKQLYTILYDKILKEEKITPLTYPRMEVVKLLEEEEGIVKMEVAIKPQVKLGNYKGVKVKSAKVKVEEKEVEEQLERLQKANAEYPPLLENRPTQEGDWLSLEMRPAVQAPSPLQKNAENLWYKLGSDQLPPSFHRELLGAKIGDEKLIETIIPPDHPQKEIAGRKISLNVKVKEIRKEKLPELNDDFARKLNFESMQSLKDGIRKELKNIKEKKERERIEAEIVEKVVKNSTVEIPPLLIEEGVEEKIRSFKEELKKKRLDVASYLKQQNMSEEELNKLFKKQVEIELKTLFVLDKIAQEEKIEVTEEEIDKRLALLVQGEDKQIRVKKLKEELARRGRLGEFVQRIRNEKTIDFLYEKAEISGKILSSSK
ncbi:trigger factor [Candidatus Aerophobetes bacterium]|nr:trigger factor [Candidatus Aerophobetes bacterium]